MAASVSVPLHLLEDIFRLLEYLDDRGAHDDLHFHKYGYARRFEHDNALWELRLKIWQLREQIVDTYILTVDGVKDNELHDLREWVAAGNSVYDNPFLLYNDSGCPMDFINGCRTAIQMDEDPSAFFGIEPDDDGDDDLDDDLPF